MRLFGRSKQPDRDAFDRGWQFYTRATTLEPPGTVFRIDGDRRRYQVGALDVASQHGDEVGLTINKRVETTLEFLVRLLGLEQLSAKANLKSVERYSFAMHEAQRAFLTDMAVDKPLRAFLDQLDFRADNRYFLIREAVSATSMTLSLTKDQAAMIGAQASVAPQVNAGAATGVGRDQLIEMPNAFPQRMRVTYLPEEIRPTRSQLGSGTPQLGLSPVSDFLMWEED